jgi:uncharacterized protein YegP (UPF0339 family)
MRFKVFQGKVRGGGLKPQFYFHVRSTNGKITLPSQAYPTAGHARRAVAQVWKSFAKAFGLPALSQAAIPYTKDSLLPVTRKKRTAVKKAAKRVVRRG